jgi:hypothetical protein
MTAVEEMELGALLELLIPTSLAGYQKDEAGSLDLLAVGFGWPRRFVKIEGFEPRASIRHGSATST